MNEWKFWLSPGFIKNESLINQRTHNLQVQFLFQALWSLSLLELSILTRDLDMSSLMAISASFAKVNQSLWPSSDFSHPPTYLATEIQKMAKKQYQKAFVVAMVFPFSHSHHWRYLNITSQLGSPAPDNVPQDLIRPGYKLSDYAFVGDIHQVPSNTLINNL